jgi:hypothetical protein
LGADQIRLARVERRAAPAAPGYGRPLCASVLTSDAAVLIVRAA